MDVVMIASSTELPRKKIFLRKEDYVIISFLDVYNNV